MASSVFFRFRSQKEPTRVTFDGTGISVFELKREIITISRLGDGTDFELQLTSSDGNEVYDDDTTIIPRSTTVIAKRLPASKAGRGGAARYVSGKAPVNAKSSKAENAGGAKVGGPGMADGSKISELQTEEERMAAVMQLGADQWAQQQQQMANATPVFRPGGKGKPTNVPDHPPPAGYVCYRCGEKGHWIQLCPTNDDPNYEGRPRIKRTTGIPKSFLKAIEKPVPGAEENADETKIPAGVMVNADGDWVVAEPDKRAWEQFQAKANRSAAAQQEAALGSKEIQDKGLQCPIDKRLFVEPVKTPCCQTTYCNDCITNALLDGGLQCPKCGKEGIVIDDLKPDDEMASKVREYEQERAAAAKTASEAKEKSDQEAEEKSPLPASPGSGKDSPAKSESADTKQDGLKESDSKKRKATSELENQRKSPAPGSAATDTEQNQDGAKTANANTKFPPELAFMNQPMGGPNAQMFGNMPMGMPFGMNPMMWNQGMPQGMPNQWQMMNGMMNMNQNPNMNMNQQGGMYGNNFNRGGHQFQQGGRGMRGRGGYNSGGYQNRGPNFQQQGNSEESAYFRQPVNPHRHQGRRNMARPTDYREL